MANNLAPQPGPQTNFMTASADIVIFGGAAGGSKGSPYSSTVFTPFGPRKMGDLKVGDTILNPTGSPQKVIQIHELGNRDIWNVNFCDGANAYVTEDHLWLTRKTRSHKTKQEPDTFFVDNYFGGEIKSTRNLLDFFEKKEKADEDAGIKTQNIIIPLCEPVKFTKSYKVSQRPVHPYLLGVLIGDGTLSPKKCKYIRYTSEDKEIAMRIGELGYDVVKCSSKYTWEIRDLELFGHLNKMGLMGKKSEGKFIPEPYLYASVEDRFELMKGLMDTDGTASKNGKCSYTTVSHVLSGNVQFLARSLGAKAAIYQWFPAYTHKGVKLNGQMAYDVSINGRHKGNFFHLTRKRERAMVDFNGGVSTLGRRISHVTWNGKEKSRCITVSHPNGLYITNEFVVTHNSYGLLLESFRHIDVPNFTGIIFRRKSTELTNPGGLWQEVNGMARQLQPESSHPKSRGKPSYELIYPSTAVIKFSHLEYEENLPDHQGGQYCFIGFDELTTFTRKMFFFLLTRNRSLCDVKPYIRATCNPDAASWVKEFIQWWIDPDTGLAIPERCGKVRHFIRDGDKIVWVDEKWRHPITGTPPKSITFIHASVDDNKILMKRDPGYKTNLLSADRVDVERFYHGNWNIRNEDGMFNVKNFKTIKPAEAPINLNWFRYWDRAATEKTEKNQNPDNTAGALCAVSSEGNLYIKDMVKFRENSAENEKRIKECAVKDGRDVTIGLELEPGSSGKDVVYHYEKTVLKDFVVRPDRPSGDKVDRCKPWCALSWHGKVFLVEGKWITPFLAEVELFPPQNKQVKKDQIDAVSGAYKLCTEDRYVCPDYGINNRQLFAASLKGMNAFKFCSMYQEKDMSIYGTCIIWNYTERKLYVYDEFHEPAPNKSAIIGHIEKKAKGATIYGNPPMFTDGENIAHLITMSGNMVNKNCNADDGGGLLVMNEMIKRSQLIVHQDCFDTDRQYREWMKENDRPSDINIGMVKGVMMVISELRDQNQIVAPVEPEPYSKEKQRRRDAARGSRPMGHTPSGSGRTINKSGRWMV